MILGSKDSIRRDYYEWITDKVVDKHDYNKVSYRKLLSYLDTIVYTPIYLMDDCREGDGTSLRYYYACAVNDPDNVSLVEDAVGRGKTCSFLEMIIGLANRLGTLYRGPDYEDMTGQYFWMMMNNLGLGQMSDDNFDRDYCDMVINRFINHRYDPKGKGSLFVLESPDYDLRCMDIWTGACWYFSEQYDKAKEEERHEQV